MEQNQSQTSAQTQNQPPYCEISNLHAPFALPKLPFALDALEPHMSKETLEFHYGKHHAGYVKKLNELLANHQLKHSSLEEIIRRSEGSLFNNAAQVWNHSFFWNCLTPNARPKPQGPLASAIDRKFGSFDRFKIQFNEMAMSLFGSGWVWLVQCSDGEVDIELGVNAHDPVTKFHENPIFTLDVWEHAYYIDYRNDRKKFIESFWNVVNWDFAESNFRTH